MRKVDDVNNVGKYSSNWVQVTDFKSKGKVVADANGHSLKLIEKRERKFGLPERIARLCFGAFLGLVSLGAWLKRPFVRQLFNKTKESVHFGEVLSSTETKKSQNPSEPLAPLKKEKSQKEIDCETSIQELESGLNLPESAIEKLKTIDFTKLHLGGKTRKSNTIDGVEFVDSHWQWAVCFKLDGYPNFLFKVNTQHISREYQDVKTEFENFVKGQTVCRKKMLNFIKIPSTKLLTLSINGVKEEVLVQRFPENLKRDRLFQEHLYRESSRETYPAFVQFAQFICETGLCNIKPYNFPIIDADSKKKVLILNFEHADDPESGLFGDRYRLLHLTRSNGVVEFLSQELSLMIKEIAENNQIETKNYQAKEKDLKLNQAIETFHQKRGIQKASQPLNVADDTLGIHLNEEGFYGLREEKTTLRQFVTDLLDEMNTQLEKPYEQFGRKRLIYIHSSQDLIQLYRYSPHSWKDQNPDLNRIWFIQVLDKLKEKGFIYDYSWRNHDTYWIQA